MVELACEFCGETECLDRCDWRVRDFVPMRVRDLEVGDQVQRFNEFCKRRAVATVAEIQDFPDDDTQPFAPIERRRVVLSIAGKTRRVKVFTASVFAAIRIKRVTGCGKVCCERCRMDRGPGGVVCFEHWHAWEQVA